MTLSAHVAIWWHEFTTGPKHQIRSLFYHREGGDLHETHYCSCGKIFWHCIHKGSHYSLKTKEEKQESEQWFGD